MIDEELRAILACPACKGRADLRGDSHHLPGVPQGLPDSRRHPRDADQRGGALDARNEERNRRHPRRRPGHAAPAADAGSRPSPSFPCSIVPFLAYQLALLRRHGVTDVVLSCSYLVDDVRRAMGDGAAPGRAPALRGRDRAARHRRAAFATPSTSSAACGRAERRRPDRRRSLRHAAASTGAPLARDDLPDAGRRSPRRSGWSSSTPTGRLRASARSRRPTSRSRRTRSMPGSTCSTAQLLDRIPTDRPVSIEREFFPGLLTERRSRLRLGGQATGSTSAARPRTARPRSTC